MRSKIYLPKSYEELKAYHWHDIQSMWRRYFQMDLPHKGRNVYRVLWYKIQCENMNVKVASKHVTKMNRYAQDPEYHLANARTSKYKVAPGTEIIKTYKGQEYRVYVLSDRVFVYEQQEYKNLSAIAREITGQRVSGNDFFGLNNKGVAS